jgi:hypothetical protein
MKDYLGVDVPDDRRGVLQDSHLGCGAAGCYFPSYAIGSAYSAQIMDRMRRDIDVYAGRQREPAGPSSTAHAEYLPLRQPLRPRGAARPLLRTAFDPPTTRIIWSGSITALYSVKAAQPKKQAMRESSAPPAFSVRKIRRLRSIPRPVVLYL